MVGLMASVPSDANIEANCAICGAPPSYPECPHEGERLELALDQAMQRWEAREAVQRIRKFALDHARNQIITTFHQLRSARVQAHHSYLQTLPYYTLYHRYNGHPPLSPEQLHLVYSQIQQANQILQQGVDQDWRTSCLQYPAVLDYYFNLAEIVLPDERHPAIQDPRFGPPPPKGGVQRKVKERRDSVDMAVREHRKKDRRRSRGRTPPPPPAPMPYRHP